MTGIRTGPCLESDTLQIKLDINFITLSNYFQQVYKCKGNMFLVITTEKNN